jgi:predicted N-acetyltransferase YhbS
VKGVGSLDRVIEIRSVRSEEYESVGDLVEAAFYQLLGDTLSNEYAIELRDVSSRAKSAEVFVALVDETIVGSVTYVGDATSPFAEDLQGGEVGIRMLAVAPSFQGEGVGRALMEFCRLKARADGARAIFLFSTEMMLGAHRLYRSMGFVDLASRSKTVGRDLYLRAFRLDL